MEDEIVLREHPVCWQLANTNGNGRMSDCLPISSLHFVCCVHFENHVCANTAAHQNLRVQINKIKWSSMHSGMHISCAKYEMSIELILNVYARSTANTYVLRLPCATGKTFA